MLKVGPPGAAADGAAESAISASIALDIGSRIASLEGRGRRAARLSGGASCGRREARARGRMGARFGNWRLCRSLRGLLAGGEARHGLTRPEKRGRSAHDVPDARAAASASGPTGDVAAHRAKGAPLRSAKTQLFTVAAASLTFALHTNFGCVSSMSTSRLGLWTLT